VRRDGRYRRSAKVARHSKADSTGRKNARPNLRLVKQNRFTVFIRIDDLVVDCSAQSGPYNTGPLS
jgi:hypothetical protein